jgi:ubiquitin-conjugating enzyme E2 N
MKNPIPGISAAPSDDDLFVWDVQLAGPQGSPYEGGWFNVELKFTENFPGQQPLAKFKTKIWHPNVDSSWGHACVSLGKGVGYGRPGGVCSITCVLVGLQMLLASPNPDDAFNHECALQMRTEPQAFEAQARAWTRMHAM